MRKSAASTRGDTRGWRRRVDDPVLRQRFAETAAGWLRLAADLANLDAQLAAERIDDKDVA